MLNATAFRRARGINKYLRQTIVRNVAAPTDQYQQPLGPATSITLRGRFDYKRHRIVRADMTDIIAEGLIFLAAGTPALSTDTWTFDGRTWKVITIRRLQFLDHQESHVEISVL